MDAEDLVLILAEEDVPGHAILRVTLVVVVILGNYNYMVNDKLYKVRYPEISKHFDSYSDYLKSPVKCIVGVDWGNKKEVSTKDIQNQNPLNEGDEIYKGTYIYGIYLDAAKERLDQELDGMVVLDNSGNSGSDQIPDDPFYYKLLKERDVNRLDDGTYLIRGEASLPYIRIIPNQSHKTVNDLCQNCFKYKKVDNTFVYSEDVSDHVKGFMKGNLRQIISKHLGDLDERLADYAKLIYFILSKLELTEDERKIIGKLSHLSPDNKQLEKLVDRELLIESLVKRVLNEDVSSNN